jgi:membrane fusion protein (multidrug efflux system)
MGRALFLLFVLAAFVAMAAAVVLRATDGTEPNGGGWAGGGVSVSVTEVRERAFSDIVEALGTANANEAVTVTAKISDTISRINFESGDLVEAGDVLVELTDTETAADLEEARATLRETERDIERIRDLTDRGVAPRSRLDEAIAEQERAEARVAAIEARLADRIIRAPFAGVVGLRQVSLGELVRPGDPVAQLDDVSIIKLDFTVPERFLSVLAPGMTVLAQSPAFPDAVFEGRISQLDSRVNPITRAITVRARVDNADARLRPGMLLTVQVERDRRTSPAVPETAVGRMREDAYVFVVEEGERGTTASQRVVSLGRRSDGEIEVISGLDVGEQIVAEGIHRVRDGAPLSIVETLGADGAVIDMSGRGGGDRPRSESE